MDHFTCTNLTCLYTDVGWLLDPTVGVSGLSHSVSVPMYSCEQTNTAIKTTGASPGSTVAIYTNMTVEVINTLDVNDAGNILHGQIRWHTPAGGTASKSGASNVTITSD
jgi:hypothetical protein